MNHRIIRACYDENTITVYQAFNKQISHSALEHQTFLSPPFKKERMTWIKPSFLWMMYRSGWASKINQEHILAIKIKHTGFLWALENSCLSHFDSNFHKSNEIWKENLNKAPVRIQWDPEKDILLQPMNYRSIQVGLSGIAVEKYVSDWIVEVEDITPYCKEIQNLIIDNKIDQVKDLLPQEITYPIPQNIKTHINYH
ncbi:DUF4291 domain-containing protein [Sphingobacterium sp.]|uniref:DUF4291 domain-containing protein n=1 Tax=Sphingobacterium sp. TaxID=341027 RepID=UPI0025E8CF9E|nr:DUF4291 domain-containing protein [Sphingobacterium sp.]